jgi:hypothetical protein
MNNDQRFAAANHQASELGKVKHSSSLQVAATALQAAK